MRHQPFQRENTLSPISRLPHRSVKALRLKNKPVLQRFASPKETQSQIQIKFRNLTPAPRLKTEKEIPRRDTLNNHYFPKDRLFRKSIIGEIKLPNKVFNISSPRADAFNAFPATPELPAIPMPQVYTENAFLLKLATKSFDGRKISMLKKFRNSILAVNTGFFNFFDQLKLDEALTQEYQKPESKEFLRACKLGDIKRLKEILKQNPSIVNVCDFVKMTGIHWAALRGNTSVIELLLSFGGNINAVDCVIST